MQREVLGFERRPRRRLVADVKQLEPVNLPLADVLLVQELMVTLLVCCFGRCLFPVASAVYNTSVPFLTSVVTVCNNFHL
jgi:hypothetical protein